MFYVQRAGRHFSASTAAAGLGNPGLLDSFQALSAFTLICGHPIHKLAEVAVAVVLLETRVRFGVVGLQPQQFVRDFTVDLMDDDRGGHFGTPIGAGFFGICAFVQ
jgi:hypothetical protein